MYSCIVLQIYIYNYIYVCVCVRTYIYLTLNCLQSADEGSSYLVRAGYLDNVDFQDIGNGPTDDGLGRCTTRFNIIDHFERSNFWTKKAKRKPAMDLIHTHRCRHRRGSIESVYAVVLFNVNRFLLLLLLLFLLPLFAIYSAESVSECGQCGSTETYLPNCTHRHRQ